MGNYTVESDRLTVQANLVTYQGTRTLFGQDGLQHAIQFEGTLSGDVATGEATDDAGKFMVRFRATKLAERP